MSGTTRINAIQAIIVIIIIKSIQWATTIIAALASRGTSTCHRGQQKRGNQNATAMQTIFLLCAGMENLFDEYSESAVSCPRPAAPSAVWWWLIRHSLLSLVGQVDT